MKGLFLKDFYTVRQLLKGLAFLFLFYAVLAVFTGNSSDPNGFIVFVMVLLGSSVFFQIFNGDKLAGWDSYAFAMPVSRRLAVFTRYAFGSFITVASSILGLIISLIIYFTKETQGKEELSLMVLSGIAILCIMMSLLFPLLYKFGVDKGRMIFVGVFMGVFLLFFTLTKLQIPSIEATIGSDITYTQVLLAISTCTLISILSLPFSAYLSTKIVEKKMYTKD